MSGKNKEVAVTHLKAFLDGDPALMGGIRSVDFDRNAGRGAASRRTVLALAAGGLAGAGPALARAAQPAGRPAGAVPTGARAAPPPIPQDQAGIRAWYERYINAFNRQDFETFSAYYADDIVFEGARGPVVGLTAVLEDFRNLFRRVDQTSNLIGFVGSPDRISVEFHVVTIGREDESASGGLKPGERRENISFAIYDLKDSRFIHARSTPFRRLPVGAAP